MPFAVIKASDYRKDGWHVNLLYMLGKELQYDIDKSGDIVYAESGQRLKITEVVTYPYSNAVSLDKGSKTEGRPSGKVTGNLDEASKWILRAIPVSESVRINKEFKDPKDRYREASVVLSKGEKRDSTAQEVTGWAGAKVSSIARVVGDTAKKTIDLGAGVGNFTTDATKGFMAEFWDTLGSITKSVIAAGVVGGVDYLITSNTTQAVVLGGIAGGGMYWYTRGGPVELANAAADAISSPLAGNKDQEVQTGKAGEVQLKKDESYLIDQGWTKGPDGKLQQPKN